MIPHVSLIECIPNIAHPTSIDFMPVPDAKIGPIVEPHGESFFTIIYWRGTPAYFANIFNIALDTASVAYLWL